MKPQTQKLVLDTLQKCLDNKVSFKMDRRKKVFIGGSFCNGYVHDYVLLVAMGKTEEEWLPIFLHESCHLDQLVEKTPHWEKGYNASEGVFSEIRPDGKIKRQHLIDLLLLEKDCEQRAIKKIKQYNLPIDIADYAQKANAYLFFYWFLYKTRKWVYGVYEHESVYTKMPKKIMNDSFYIKPPKKYMDLFNQFL